ncbi:MAG TPA: hypothetical protein VM431_15350 [Phycisphaerae bacterium]|nr:hypothetical protein [Phycisphaerae bacterium]
MSHLTASMGVFRLDAASDFFFEPTPGFYGFISQGVTSALNDAMQMLARHIGSPTAPVIEPWDGPVMGLTAGSHDFAAGREPPGLIRHDGPFRSRIHLALENMHSPFILGGILAHELTHHYMAGRGIALPDAQQNERLTDVASVYIGLGKLTLNGYEPMTWAVPRGDGLVRYTYRVGYLESADLALVMAQVCAMRAIEPHAPYTNLTDQARGWMGLAAPKVRDYELRKSLVGERQCPKCGKMATFSFGDSDDLVYCSNCGWEWEAILRDLHRRRTRRWWHIWKWLR